jgi:AraC-like DNA-binding protein
MDPLSDVLSLLRPRSAMSGGFDAGGAWSIRFARHQGVKCYAVVAGRCWLEVEDVAEPALLNAGDCFLLPGGRPFRLASDLALTPVDAATIFHPARDGGIASINGGGDFFLAGGHFLLSGEHATRLLGALPPIVHLRQEADRDALRWSLQRMAEELRERRPGGSLVAQHLAHLMLVQALRLHLAEGGRAGWLFSLSDRQMGAAIGAMHEDPARRWSLRELAALAGMSRSVFAQRFKQAVGESPLEYLRRWRMLLAADRLAHSGQSIAAIARSLGYESESAFGAAFRRVMGASPRRYGRA